MRSQETEAMLSAMYQIKKFMNDFHSNHHEQLPQMAFFAMMQIEEKATTKEIDGIAVNVSTIADLEAVMKVSKPAISRLLKELEQKGYISRIPSSQDKRNIYLSLTKEGSTLLQKQVACMDHRTNLFMEKLGMEDAHALIRILRKIPSVMEEVLYETTMKGENENE